eukprot:11197711-Lingulodinium_polyedra.AAC.1
MVSSVSHGLRARARPNGATISRITLTQMLATASWSAAFTLHAAIGIHDAAALSTAARACPRRSTGS